MKLASFFLLCFGSAVAFAPASTPARTQTSLEAHDAQKFAASCLLGAAVAASLFTSDPAVAMDFGPSSEILAARSGGRAGGRSSYGGAKAMKSSSPQVIERRTTVIQSAPSAVYVAPPVYGYNPMPGLGLSLGLNAMSDMGNTMRDMRQEGEIQDARAKNAELEARLRQMEMQMQYQQQQQMQLQMQK